MSDSLYFAPQLRPLPLPTLRIKRSSFLHWLEISLSLQSEYQAAYIWAKSYMRTVFTTWRSLTSLHIGLYGAPFASSGRLFSDGLAQLQTLALGSSVLQISDRKSLLLRVIFVLPQRPLPSFAPLRVLFTLWRLRGRQSLQLRSEIAFRKFFRIWREFSEAHRVLRIRSLLLRGRRIERILRRVLLFWEARVLSN